MFRKIINYLNLRQAGGLELFFALLMVLSAYSFMGIPMQVILWVGLFAMLFFKRRRVSFPAFRPLFILATFVLIHDFFYLFIANGNLNAFIMQILYFGCMFMAIKVFNVEKLKGSLNLVDIISMIGLFYQWKRYVLFKFHFWKCRRTDWKLSLFARHPSLWNLLLMSPLCIYH